MNIIERVQALNLPKDQYIVIGSGILDAYGIREAHDVDLAVTPELFTQLEHSGTYEKGMKDDGPYLMRDDVEVWLGWGKGNDFSLLKQSAVEINDIFFINPQFLIERKRERGTQKDMNDVAALEEYLHER